MRMIRVSPPLLAREFAGPYMSTSATLAPRRVRCHAVHAPNTPAPITATSNVLLVVMRQKLVRRYPTARLQRLQHRSRPCRATRANTHRLEGNWLQRKTPYFKTAVRLNFSAHGSKVCNDGLSVGSR